MQVPLKNAGSGLTRQEKVLLDTEVYGILLPFSSVGNCEGSGCDCVWVWNAQVLGSRVGERGQERGTQKSEAPRSRK